jgi:hypothetical protein
MYFETEKWDVEFIKNCFVGLANVRNDDGRRWRWRRRRRSTPAVAATSTAAVGRRATRNDATTTRGWWWWSTTRYDDSQYGSAAAAAAAYDSTADVHLSAPANYGEFSSVTLISARTLGTRDLM